MMLRDYQKDAVEWLGKNRKGLLEADVGAGKTLILLTALANDIANNPAATNKILIVCSKNAINTWVAEIKKWYPTLITHNLYKIFSLSNATSKTQRTAIWTEFFTSVNGIAICTYGILRADADIICKKYYRNIIMDEAHRGGIRNHKSKTFEVFTDLAKLCGTYHWTTATLFDDSAMDYFATCKLALPKQFNSYWRFANTFCNVIDGIYGKQVIGLKNPEAFRDATRSCIYKVDSEIIEKQKPKLIRHVIELTLNKQIAKIYTEFTKELLYISADLETIIAATNTISMIQKARQLLCCPQLLDPSLDVGGKIETIIDMLEDFQDIHCIIFVPFRNAVNIFTEVLVKLYPGKVVSLYGGITPDELATRVEYAKKHRCIVVATIQFAESYQIETVKNVFFASFCYTANENIQAEGRAHRLITPHSINVYYIMHSNTLDMRVYQLLCDKFEMRKPMNDLLIK